MPVCPALAAQIVESANAHAVKVRSIKFSRVTLIGTIGGSAVFAAAGKAGIKFAKVGYWRYALKDVRAEVAAMGRDLAGLAELAKKNGVTIGIHNHQGNVGSALWEIAPYIDKLDAQAIGYYFDPRHALMEGGGVGWKAATLLALPRMKMISVKDAFWEKGPKGWAAQHCPMGEGMVDWPWFATTIAALFVRGTDLPSRRIQDSRIDTRRTAPQHDDRGKARSRVHEACSSRRWRSRALWARARAPHDTRRTFLRQMGAAAALGASPARGVGLGVRTSVRRPRCSASRRASRPMFG